MNPKVGLGGSCHWCTEGIFRSINGVDNVRQGWIASNPPNDSFSEAILFQFDPCIIMLSDLIAIHLHSHSCSGVHVMRNKYRSTIYVFNKDQELASRRAIEKLQPEFDRPIITQVLPFKEFKLNSKEYLNYYHRNPEKPFCKNFIEPKLRSLMKRYSDVFKLEQLTHLEK